VDGRPCAAGAAAGRVRPAPPGPARRALRHRCVRRGGKGRRGGRGAEDAKGQTGAALLLCLRKLTREIKAEQHVCPLLEKLEEHVEAEQNAAENTTWCVRTDEVRQTLQNSSITFGCVSSV
jgi:hypothetical protein